MTIELAYLVIDAHDPAAVAAVLTDVVGLMPGEPAAGCATWRNDAKVHRVLVREGASNDVAAAGYELPGPAELAATLDRLRALGVSVHEGTADERAERRVDALWHVASPWGVELELVTGLATAGAPLEAPLMPSGFVTDGMGLGHCVFFVADLAEAHRFVTEGLGMRRSDRLGFEVAPGVSVNGSFYHGNPRHHTTALVCPPELPPFRLHHVMFEVNDQDDVGRAFDRAYAAGLPIPNGIGKHPNDLMVSFYLQTPAFFQIEVGTGGRLVGDDWDLDIEYDRISAWGHQPVARG